MKAKTIKDTLNEAAISGAGFAVWGGGSRGGFGNSRGMIGGRGFGFGSANNGSGSPNMMYTYDIKPLNKTLEPPASCRQDEPVIHRGSVVKGKVLGKDKHVIGQVISIEEDHDNNVMYYVVLDPDTAIKIKLDPTSSYVWDPPAEGITPVGSENMDTPDAAEANEGLMDSIKDFEK